MVFHIHRHCNTFLVVVVAEEELVAALGVVDFDDMMTKMDLQFQTFESYPGLMGEVPTVTSGWVALEVMDLKRV